MKIPYSCKVCILAVVCALSVMLCSCADVTSSADDNSTTKNTANTTTLPQSAALTTAASTFSTTSVATTLATTTTTAVTTEQTTVPETTTEEQTFAPATQTESSPAAVPTAPTDFDASYFDDALFIGDSITTGLYLYGYLDQSLVYAKLGLAPSTALDSEIDGETIDSKIKANKPSKIYIMLGTNSVGYADGEYLAACMGELVQHISKVSKAKIYVLSIPPITYYAEADYDNALTTSAINEYNGALENVISGTKAKFLDLHSVLTAPDGYYYEEYHEMDGIHFMGSTYQVMLSFLEKHS